VGDLLFVNVMIAMLTGIQMNFQASGINSLQHTTALNAIQQ